jgi:hypothetical protein
MAEEALSAETNVRSDVIGQADRLHDRGFVTTHLWMLTHYVCPGLLGEDDGSFLGIEHPSSDRHVGMLGSQLRRVQRSSASREDESRLPPGDFLCP